MAKLPAKKSAPKKAAKKSAPKKSAAKKSPAKKTAKKPLSEKELMEKEANRLVNSSKKAKSPGRRPKKNSTAAQTTGLLDAIIDGMEDKKAKNITIINMQGLEGAISDYLVICDADSTTHVDAIANSLEGTVKKHTGESAYHSEGFQNSEWIIVDYINIVAHIFLKEKRDFYNLEGLWADGEVTHIN